jgi:hypothetical protein
MASQAGAGLMSFGHWIRDRLWPSLDGPEPKPEATSFAFEGDPCGEVLRAVYARLAEEMNAEADRRRAVEAKLASMASLAPLTLTITSGLATFLTSATRPQFVRGSVIPLVFVAAYVALQLLRATLAAVHGLRRMGYSAAAIDNLLSSTGNEDAYLKARAMELASRIEQHRFTTSRRVEQLALAHEAVINAVFGLIAIVATLFVLPFLE